MCRRYRLLLDEELHAALDGKRAEADVASGDVAPTDMAAVIANNRRLKPDVFPMRWGYTGASLVVNARSETAYERPMFAESMKKRRCLIPASWYYEWERRGRERVRYAIRPQCEGMMYMAGLYRLTQTGAQFVILTRDASPDVAFIHPRMPVILPRETMAEWIDLRGDGQALLREAVLSVRFGAA